MFCRLLNESDEYSFPIANVLKSSLSREMNRMKVRGFSLTKQVQQSRIWGNAEELVYYSPNGLLHVGITVSSDTLACQSPLLQIGRAYHAFGSLLQVTLLEILTKANFRKRLKFTYESLLDSTGLCGIDSKPIRHVIMFSQGLRELNTMVPLIY